MSDDQLAEDVMQAIGAQRVVPVLRCSSAADAVATAAVAVRAGMGAVELTTSIPDVGEAIRVLAAQGATVGLGTVRSAAEVAAAVEAGARFVVSFHRPDGLIARAHELGVAAIPGALTPNEIVAARDEGADAVKIFPARVVGPAYLGDLASLVPGLRAVATGGVHPTAAGLGEWLKAGAFAVGLGSALGTVAGVGEREVARRCEFALEVASAAAE